MLLQLLLRIFLHCYMRLVNLQKILCSLSCIYQGLSCVTSHRFHRVNFLLVEVERREKILRSHFFFSFNFSMLISDPQHVPPHDALNFFVDEHFFVLILKMFLC